jgi:hypothetical protein
MSVAERNSPRSVADLRIVLLPIDAVAFDIRLMLKARTLAARHDPIGFGEGLIPMQPRLTPHQAPGLRPRQLAGLHALANALRLIMFTLIQHWSGSKYRSRDGEGDD